MYVSSKLAGKLTYIKMNDSGSGRPGKIKGVPTSLKVRRKALDAKRWNQVLIDLRGKVAATKVTEICFDDNVTGLMTLVALYGNTKPYHTSADIKHKEAVKLIKTGRKKVLETLWETFKPTLDNLLIYIGPIAQMSKEYIMQANWIAVLIGADVKGMFKEVSKQKGFTVPKSWASLNADGTTKKAKPAKKAKSKQAKPKQAKIKKTKAKPEKQICRVCGYSDSKGNDDGGVKRTWVEEGLCSNCEVYRIGSKKTAQVPAPMAQAANERSQ